MKLEVAIPLLCPFIFLNQVHYLQLVSPHPLKMDKQDGDGHFPIPLREDSKNGGDQPCFALLRLSFLLKIRREVIISPLYRPVRKNGKNGGGHPSLLLYLLLKNKDKNEGGHLPIP